MAGRKSPLLISSCFVITPRNKPAHDKTYNKTYATSEDSDQPAHPRSLIRVFADRIWLLQPSSYPKRDKQKPLSFWLDAQADLSLYWSHKSYCRFCNSHLLRCLYHGIQHRLTVSRFCDLEGHFKQFLLDSPHLLLSSLTLTCQHCHSIA